MLTPSRKDMARNLEHGKSHVTFDYGTVGIIPELNETDECTSFFHLRVERYRYHTLATMTKKKRGRIGRNLKGTQKRIKTNTDNDAKDGKAKEDPHVVNGSSSSDPETRARTSAVFEESYDDIFDLAFENFAE